MAIPTLTIVGVGLIGGSIGLAARQRRVAARIRGVGRNAASLETARRRGAIDEAYLDVAAAARGADVIVFCTPVDRIAAQVREAAPHCRRGALLTDAGSTKAAIVRQLEGALPDSVAFVGSHPLAGSEKKGPEFADADLFDGRITVVTPTAGTHADATQRACAFWESLGSRVLLMSPEEHDRALAVTSHLPHLVASALARLLTPELRPLAASGFRDTTRVASGDVELWTAILEHNREAVLAALERFRGSLDEFAAALAGDRGRLPALLAEGKTVRDALGS